MLAAKQTASVAWISHAYEAMKVGLAETIISATLFPAIKVAL